MVVEPSVQRMLTLCRFKVKIRAIRQQVLRRPGVLDLVGVSRPEPDPTELLVRVATAVSATV